MSSRKASSKQISYKDESSSEEDSDLEKVDKKVIKKGRRSQKKQKKEEENESSESEFELEKEKPKGKKGKGKGKRGGGKEGKGKEKEIKKNPFDVLPFELFTEILSYLSPKDLLHLARTNKSYRSILLSKQRSETLWKRSLESIGLPIPTTSDWALPAYADLILHVDCLECEKKAPAWLDPWLRIRLCKSCRQDRVVKLTEYLVQSKEYHPLIKDCMGGSQMTPSETRYLCSGEERYVLSSAIYEINEQLLELQEEDSLDSSVNPEWYRREGNHYLGYSWVPIAPTAQQGKKQKKSSNNSDGAQRSTRGKVQKQSYYEDDSEDEDEKRCKVGPRVEAFLKEKKELNKKMNEDALAIRAVALDVVRRVKSEENAHKKRMKFLAANPFLDEDAVSRREEIEKRLDALQGYAGHDLDHLEPTALAEFLEGDTLNDADWKRLKPELLHLIDAAKTKERLKDLEARLFSAESERKNSLRRYYDKVLEETQEGRFPPLFVDFLVLPSVHLLWKRKNDQDFRQIVTGLEWIMKRDSVIDDLQEYHLDLVDKAVRLIISTTREYSDEDEFETLVEQVLAGDLDSFFSQATSMVFCDGGCEVETYTSMWYYRIKKRKVAAHFDTFPQVIKHQIETHNDYEAPSQPAQNEKRQTEVGFRFTLPLEVACVVSDLVDVVHSRPKLKVEEEDEGEEGEDSPEMSSVTRERLDTLDDGNFVWMNQNVGSGFFSSWMKLVKRVYVVARKAAKSRPPVDLDPPDIRWSLPLPLPSSHLSTSNVVSGFTLLAQMKARHALDNLENSSDEEKPDLSGQMEEEEVSDMDEEYGENEQEERSERGDEESEEDELESD
ncbi:hypothetical protein JCM5353_008987 [Sporobolomyces roseus]